MKKIYTVLCRLFFFFILFKGVVVQAYAQCGAGYTQAQLNWDNLDFLPSNNSNYTSFYTAGTRPYDQTFTIGTRRVNFTIAPTGNMVLNGENTTNTADAGSFSTPGNDVHFITNTFAATTVTMTFDSLVTNVRFSLFDLDNSQRVTVTATNDLAVPQLITIANANAGSGIIIAGSGTATAIATAPGTGYAGSNNNGTVNISVAGPVQTIVLTFDNASGDVWLSDIDACITGSFPTGYRNVSRPFTGMPSYILTVVDSIFMLLDPATGRAKVLFNDPGHSNMNGMAYDPHNRILYYTYSLTSSPSTTKTIYKYSVDNETISTFVADVTQPPLNIPTYNPGVTSGSASFYNGSLYFGIEASNSSRNSGRENTVWKIDFDASLNPIRASQVYATRADSNISGSNRLIHDWSDIGVTNSGILYDFDGAGAGTSNRDSMYYHFDMMTGQRIQFAPSGAGNIGPKQTAIDWQENVYNMGGLPTSSGTAQSIGGFIAPYNYDGTVNNAQNYLVYTMPGPVYLTGSWGDCSEAFRPLCDFGDAPSSYDPDPLSPAVNERDTALRIGSAFDREWDKTSSALADADGSDEDGIGTVTIFATAWTTYHVEVSVYNNTGADATLIGWLDYNGNGVFDAGEASAAATVPSMGTMQNVDLYWTGISSTLPSGSYTYLRVRLTSAAYNMTSAHATGWFDNGETEDYRVPVENTVLPVNLITFDAKTVANTSVKLTWSASDETQLKGYEVQRTANGYDWEYVAFVPALRNDGAVHQYEITDNKPYKGTSRYRLKMKEENGAVGFSEVRIIKITGPASLMVLFPNPANDHATATITGLAAGETIQVQVADEKGNRLFAKRITAAAGNNVVELPVVSWPSGTYIVTTTTEHGTASKKLVLRR